MIQIDIGSHPLVVFEVHCHGRSEKTTLPTSLFMDRRVKVMGGIAFK